MSNVIKLKDKVNNKEVVVSVDDVGPLVKSGRYELPLGKTMPVLNPDGDLGEIPTEQYTQALDAGYVPATSTDIQKKVDINTYGDSPLQTGLERAASTASFGLTDFIASKVAPHYAEEMAKREEYNPGAAITGDIAGIVGPALLSGGLSAGAKAAASGTSALAKAAAPVLSTAAKATNAVGIPVKMAEKLGASTAKAVSRVLPSNGIAAKIVQEMVPRAAGMGVEGALFGAGNALSDVSLGNIDATTESIMGEIGLNAFIGAGLGAGIGAINSIATPVVNRIVGMADADKVIEEYAGIGTKTAKKKIADRGIQNAEVADLLKNKIGLTVGKNQEEILSGLKTFQDDAGMRIGDALEQLKNADQEILPSIGNFRKKLFKSLDEMADELKVNGKPIVGEVDKVKFLSSLKSEIDDMFGISGLPKAELEAAISQKMNVDSLQAIRKSLDSNAKFASTADNFKPDVFKELRKPVRDMIDELAEKVSPDLAQSLKQANRDYFISTSIEPFLEASLRKTAGRNLFDVKDAIYSMPMFLSGHGSFVPFIITSKKILDSQMGQNARLLYSIEASKQKMAKAIGSGVHDFFLNTGKTVKPAVFQFSQNKKQDNYSSFDAYAEKLRKYADNPELYLQEINAKNVGLHKHIPNLLANSEVKAMAAINFLNSKLPRKAGDVGLIQRPFKPTTQQLAKFARYAEIVENPRLAMQHLKAGTLTKENVEALKAVYPEIYKQVVDKSAAYIDKYGSKLPYNKKIQLGIMLGMPVDTSMTSKALRNFQSGFLQSEGPSAGVVNSTVTGTKELNKANRLIGK